MQSVYSRTPAEWAADIIKVKIIIIFMKVTRNSSR